MGYRHNSVTEMKDPGAWFEEYVYYRIKKEKSLDDGFIHSGVKIYRSKTNSDNDNEIDIVYTIDNELYIGECKISLNGAPGCDSGTKLLETYLYKLAAISIDFGLNVRQLFFTLHRLKHNPSIQIEAVTRRMKILRLEVLIDRGDFNEKELPIKFQK